MLLEEGDRLLAVAEQDGVDIAIEIVAPGGQPLEDVDTGYELEPIALVAQQR
ncbi:MAG TPA: hypothetical protein VMN78_13550 [Longimicrobiales bacterium]|nr:hypothetical protein [Longimicrobiales bacterium]